MSVESSQVLLNENEIQSVPDSEIDVFFPKDHNLRRWLMIISGGLLILVASVFASILALNTYTSVLRHGRAVLLNNVIPILPLVFIAIPFGLLIIMWAKTHWDDQLTINESGIFQQNGKKERSWVWDETEKLNTLITEIQFGGSSVGTKVKLQLTDENNRKWLIRNRYENILELVEKIREKVLPVLYNKAIQKFATNEEIKFHPGLTATKTGLRINNQQILWEEHLESPVRNNKLIIKYQENQEPIFKSELDKIENLDLLLCLVENPPEIQN